MACFCAASVSLVWQQKTETAVGRGGDRGGGGVGAGAGPQRAFRREVGVNSEGACP